MALKYSDHTLRRGGFFLYTWSTKSIYRAVCNGVMPNTRLTQGLCQPHVSPRSFEIYLGCTWDTSGHFVTKRSTSENLSLHQNKHATNGRLKRGRSFWRSYLNAVRILVRIFSKFGPNLYRSWPKSSKLFQMDTNYTEVFHSNGTE